MIYEYKCLDCEKLSEFWMKISDPHPTECPACQGKRLERVISKTAFALKGSGWYTSDYKKSGSAATQTASTSTTATPSSTSESSSSPASSTSCCSGGSCSHKS